MDILNSEFCLVNGKEMVYFRYPYALFTDIEKTLQKIGAEKFFSDPHSDIKKIRESMAEYFFAIALKKMTKKDWLVMQPQKEFPDFALMSVSDEPNKITIEQFELVEIMSRCQSFEEMLKIVEGKIKKGYPENYNLLIFINHIKSKEWLPLLHKAISIYYPFKAIWTVHLLFSGKDNPYNAVINRIRPVPVCHAEANFIDKSLYELEKIPHFIDMHEINGYKIMTFKKEFIKDLIKKMKMVGLGDK
jgi:hypothetical protein